LFAQAQHQPTLWFNVLDKEAGLSSNTNITGVFQDSEGFTWISTYGAGLNQFDGVSVKHFRMDSADSTSLSSNQVYGDFFEDRNKNIWFCTAKSIECYVRKKNHFRHFEVVKSAGKSIEQYAGLFFLERDSFLWGQAEMDSVLFRYNIFDTKDQKEIGYTKYNIALIPGIQADGVLKYIFSIDGSKSAGLELFELDRQGNIIRQENYFHKESSALKLNIHSVVFKNEKEVWLSTSQGLFSWDLKNEPVLNPLLSDPLHQSILLDTASLLIKKGHKKGFISFDEKNQILRPVDVFVTSKFDGSIAPTIKKPFGYSQNILWMEYQKSGLVFCNPKKAKFRYLQKPKLTTTNYSYRSILQTSNKNIWYITYPMGLVQCDPQGNLLRAWEKINAPLK